MREGRKDRIKKRQNKGKVGKIGIKRDKIRVG